MDLHSACDPRAEGQARDAPPVASNTQLIARYDRLRGFGTDLYFSRVSKARYLQRKPTAASAGRLAIAGARAGFAVLIATFLSAAGPCLAQDAAKKKANAPLEEVVVRGAREAADEQITAQVQTALANDPWIYAEHVTVTTENGIVRVEGITSDPWEMRRILREARKTPGVRRVLNQLEMIHLDPEGG